MSPIYQSTLSHITQDRSLKNLVLSSNTYPSIIQVILLKMKRNMFILYCIVPVEKRQATAMLYANNCQIVL